MVSASVTRFDAAMRREPTTTLGSAAAGASDPTRDEGAPVRSGWLLRLELRCGAVGWGEASPLPGLSAETHAEAGAQLAALAALLDGSLSASNTASSGGGGVLLPAELPLLGGAVARWLARDVGVADVDALLPSARFAVESAALEALAEATGGHLFEGGGPGGTRTEDAAPEGTLALAPPLASVLFGARTPSEEDSDFFASSDASADRSNASSASASTTVSANALATTCAGPPELAVAEAEALVRAGHRCLKFKVARPGSTPLEDAARLSAVRRAVGPGVGLRADANRGWALNDALTFGLGVLDADLEYVEEPVADPLADLAAFHCTTGVAVALDETVDELARGGAREGPGRRRDLCLSAAARLEPYLEPTFGVRAVVLKPTTLGGFENAALVAAAARARGVRAVVTAAFESSVGVEKCAHLAAALDGEARRFAAELGARALAKAEARKKARLSKEDDGDESAFSFSAEDESDSSSFLVEESDALSSSEDSEASLVASLAEPPAHGLGTGAWLAGDPLESAAVDVFAPLEDGRGLGATLRASSSGGGAKRLRSDDAASACVVGEPIGAAAWGRERRVDVETDRGAWTFRVLDSRRFEDEEGEGEGEEKKTTTTKKAAASRNKNGVVLFLHGFLGGAEDWAAVVPGVLASGVASRAVAVDLPGHGGSPAAPPHRGAGEEEGEPEAVTRGGEEALDEASGDAEGGFDTADAMDAWCDALAALAETLLAEDDEAEADEDAGDADAGDEASSARRVVTLVGYSMGARVALRLASTRPDLFGLGGVASIGGGFGLTDPIARRDRLDRDDALARALVAGGARSFAELWYEQPLFASTCETHPRWRGGGLARRRAGPGADPAALAAALRDLSPGRVRPVADEELAAISRGEGGGEKGGEGRSRLLLAAGERDPKFRDAAEAAARRAGGLGIPGVPAPETAIVPGAGHAAHVEAPEALVVALVKFMEGR